MGYRIYGDDIEPLNTVAQAEALSYSKNTIVSVLETGRTYQFDPASTAVRDGIRVLTPAGGGRLLMTAPVMTDAEVAAATRMASPSQSGLMSQEQAKSLQYIAADSSGNVSITPAGLWTYINSYYLNCLHTLILGEGGISSMSGDAYFRSKGDNPSVINVRVRIKDSTGNLQDGLGFFPTWVNSTPGSFSVSTAVGALGKTAFTIKSTSTIASVEFNGDVKVGIFEASGKSIVVSDTFTVDATLTQSSKSVAVCNPVGAGQVLTMHLSPPNNIVQATVNTSAFTVTLGRNSQLMAGLAANYILPAKTSITWQFFGATIGWLPISTSTW